MPPPPPLVPRAPDGSCVLSNSADNVLRLYNLPPELYAQDWDLMTEMVTMCPPCTHAPAHVYSTVNLYNCTSTHATDVHVQTSPKSTHIKECIDLLHRCIYVEKLVSIHAYTKNMYTVCLYYTCTCAYIVHKGTSVLVNTLGNTGGRPEQHLQRGGNLGNSPFHLVSSRGCRRWSLLQASHGLRVVLRFRHV